MNFDCTKSMSGDKPKFAQITVGENTLNFEI